MKKPTRLARKLSRISTIQLTIVFDLRVLEEAWCVIGTHPNPVLINISNAIWEKVNRKRSELDKNKRRCAQLAQKLNKQ